jgi:hypothetical protein
METMANVGAAATDQVSRVVGSFVKIRPVANPTSADSSCAPTAVYALAIITLYPFGSIKPSTFLPNISVGFIKILVPCCP